MLPPSGRDLDWHSGAKARHCLTGLPPPLIVPLDLSRATQTSGLEAAGRGSAGGISDGRRSFLMVPAQPWHLTCLTGYGHSFMAKRSFGEILKSEREIREVTLNEVTVATRIPPRFLEAFEQEDWEKLPGGVFNRGFVRAIARYLGLNEENLLSEYDLAYGEQQAAATALVENPIPSPPKWIVAVAALGVLIVVGCVLAGGVYGWRRYQARRAAKRAAVAAVTAAPPTLPSIAPTSPGASVSSPSPLSSTHLDLSVSTSDVTRIRIVADGRVVLDARVPALETRHFSARNQFVVSVAHPSAVLLELNGQAMPQLGTGGTSGTLVLSQKNLRQAPSGNAQP